MAPGSVASLADTIRPAGGAAGRLGRPAVNGPPQSPTVLLVEDDFALLKLMRRVLAEHGYTVLEARNGTEALEAARVHPGDVDLLVTDVVMPALGGVGLARALRERRPDLPALFVSGYAPQVVEPGSRFLAKPFSPARLAAEVRALLADRQPAG